MSKWWTKSWNPMTGCTPVSEACDHCYAERMARRFAGRAGYPGGKDYFKPTIHPHRLEEPFKWKKAGRIFVGNMGDIFHDDVPDSFLDEIFFPAYVLTDQQWFFLTKRVDRMVEYLSRKSRLGPNVFLGVTAETQAWADRRISELMRVRESQKDVNFFVSVEPMLSAVSLREWLEISRLAGTEKWVRSGFKPMLGWIQCGGENGPGARPLHPDWVRSLKNQCATAQVPFFFKGWGEWGTSAFNVTTGDPEFRVFDSFQRWVNKGDTWIHGGTCIDMEGKTMKTGGDMKAARYPVAIMHRVGKKTAGRLLNGREWNEFPRREQVR